VAEELLALSPKAVRFLNKAGAQVGFLSDEEIHARATCADAPLRGDATAEAAPATAGTFITVKRAPRS
jgi:hypothetical protein